MSEVVLDLHGARAHKGVDIDALESFLAHFRTALREWSRADRGSIARKGGRPFAHESAASAFRLVEFHTGSGIATLAPSVPGVPADDLGLNDPDDALAMTTLLQLFAAIRDEETIPATVVEALSSARKAIGDDGHFGVKVSGPRPLARVVIDTTRIAHLQLPDPEPLDSDVHVTGRLHLIEADPPNRRVGILAQDGIDWTCTYPDSLHPLVTTLVEKLVRLAGTGRRTSAATGRLTIERLVPIPEHLQDELFTVGTISVLQLQEEQRIVRPQGLGALIAADWENDEEDRLFLEATLGTSKR